MNFDNTYQTGNPMSGGWRFPYSRQTSVDALNYAPMGVDNDFLKKVAALAKGQDPQKTQGLLDQALSVQPLDGLLGGGNDVQQSAGGQGMPGNGPQSMSEAGNPMTQASAGGWAPNLANAGKGIAALGPLGLLGGLIGGQRLAPVYDLNMSGMNGFNDVNYGSSPTANGPTTEAQANALAQALAAQLAMYGSPGMDGGFGGQGGYGGVDGAGSADFGGPAGGWGI